MGLFSPFVAIIHSDSNATTLWDIVRGWYHSTSAMSHERWNAIASFFVIFLEQSGHGLNMARMLWRGLKQDERIIHFTFNGVDWLPSLFSTSESFRLFSKNYSVEGNHSAIGSGNDFAFFNKAATIANAHGCFNGKPIVWTDFPIHKRIKTKVAPSVERTRKSPKKRFFALLYW